ncbi:MAG: hypothetical protein M1570_15620, partial [Chloroflexi bacterium]|nr:hypothetical protein [Chloroflexota bacterium]
ELPVTQLPAYIAMNAGAYWIGYASFVTPSGLGVREGVLAWMLGIFRRFIFVIYHLSLAGG